MSNFHASSCPPLPKLIRPEELFAGEFLWQKSLGLCREREREREARWRAKQREEKGSINLTEGGKMMEFFKFKF